MTAPTGAPINILVVDDTPENLRLLAAILSEHNYKVRLVPSASLIEDAIHESPPDLILLDVMMPDANGFEVCERLKADPETAHIPVIFLTAKTQNEDIVKGFEVGGVIGRAHV